MLKRPEGYFVRLHVPPDAKGFESLKPGDSVKATYYENVILTLEKAGAVAHTREPVGPVATGADEHKNPDLRRIVTVTVTGIDDKFGNIAFTENGQPYLARVEDKGLLKKAKAGDKVDITYTQATLVSLQ
jgi:hypothetical protein